MKGGSGGWFNQFYFTSMFSIHDSENINIFDSNFSSNKIYDDTIHIVYSDNIKLKNIKIKNAFRDAIDVDVSNNIYLEHIDISSPKNDGVDFMESSAVINNLKIYDSKDKGISIGEKSSIVIKNSVLSNNIIGIAVKDASQATIHNTTFDNNSFQLAGYAKNWRYSGGGKVDVYKSKFISVINKFSSFGDPTLLKENKNNKLIENSIININGSLVEGKIETKGKNIFFN